MPDVDRPGAGDRLNTPGASALEIVNDLVDRVSTPLLVGPTLPVLDPMPDVYAWLQTGLGSDGSGWTLWIEDGT